MPLKLILQLGARNLFLATHRRNGLLLLAIAFALAGATSHQCAMMRGWQYDMLGPRGRESESVTSKCRRRGISGRPQYAHTHNFPLPQGYQPEISEGCGCRMGAKNQSACSGVTG